MIAQRRACRENFLYPIEYHVFIVMFDVRRAALNDTVLTVKENCLTNLQNVLAHDYAI